MAAGRMGCNMQRLHIVIVDQTTKGTLEAQRAQCPSVAWYFLDLEDMAAGRMSCNMQRLHIVIVDQTTKGTLEAQRAQCPSVAWYFLMCLHFNDLY